VARPEGPGGEAARSRSYGTGSSEKLEPRRTVSCRCATRPFGPGHPSRRGRLDPPRRHTRDDRPRPNRSQTFPLLRDRRSFLRPRPISHRRMRSPSGAGRSHLRAGSTPRGPARPATSAGRVTTVGDLRSSRHAPLDVRRPDPRRLHRRPRPGRPLRLLQEEAQALSFGAELCGPMRLRRRAELRRPL